MRAWRGFFCLVAFLALQACGDDDSGPGTAIGNKPDGSMMRGKPDAGGAGGAPTHHRDASATTDASAAVDAGSDSGFNPLDFDAGAAKVTPPPKMMVTAGPVPKGWTCPKALWADGHCDCGCSVTDFDCKQFSCTDPGCVDGMCDACFTLTGSWKPCAPDPSMNDWTCDPLAISDGLCDCGCGIPDPGCKGSGCDTPGCRKQACDVRHGCTAAEIAAGDDCTSNNPKVLTNAVWTCPWDRYASGDGCDCGCGAIDPDCGDVGGCSVARCFQDACVRCADDEGRPYDCDAAKAGWDQDIVGDSTTSEPSLCNSVHFGSGDGCDCGCGGHDPDCGKKGCDAPGCYDAACKRCTDATTLRPTGCPTTGDVASTWVDTNKCNPDNYGTGDGCDCGCGTPDPDCAGKGCTTPGCTDAACGVCNDGKGFFVPCAGWTCGAATDPAFANAECDCGCGVIDPFCRDTHRDSCTKAGCEVTTCQFCNDSGNRSACGGEWTGDTGGTSSACNVEDYDYDGLCDCGCGAHDPDCAKGQDCVDKGCNAPDCDVCHDGSLLALCYTWTCSAASFGTGDGCDCGCGARDPDCGTGGCQEPGCNDAACKVCHDPFGRALPCP
jgi:hypothetical protein